MLKEKRAARKFAADAVADVKRAQTAGGRAAARNKRDTGVSSAGSLREINEKLAATRAMRLALAEANCVKMTGKNRL